MKTAVYAMFWLCQLAVKQQASVAAYCNRAGCEGGGGEYVQLSGHIDPSISTQRDCVVCDTTCNPLTDDFCTECSECPSKCVGTPVLTNAQCQAEAGGFSISCGPSGCYRPGYQFPDQNPAHMYTEAQLDQACVSACSADGVDPACGCYHYYERKVISQLAECRVRTCNINETKGRCEQVKGCSWIGGTTCSNAAWSKCGGANFKGKTCCPAGYSCTVENKWYSQCKPAPSTCANALWEQCGGNEWKGKTCCPAGSKCVKKNEWYSQCVSST